ncbi:transposable element Tcb2 transposase [Trichonephila clavipes]|nr:transposable element Tcb2 transposase [Trichonephila clavipes]
MLRHFCALVEALLDMRGKEKKRKTENKVDEQSRKVVEGLGVNRWKNIASNRSRWSKLTEAPLAGNRLRCFERKRSGRSDCVVRRCWDHSGSRRCHLHEYKAQDALDIPVVENTSTFDESRFNLSSDDNRVRVWRPYCERLNPAFALQRHTTPTAGVMVWGAIAYNTLSPLVLIHSIMTAQCKGVISLSSHCYTLPSPDRSSDLSPIEHIWDPLGRQVGHPTNLNEL